MNPTVSVLGHQLPRPLPSFAELWSTLDGVFRWLAGLLHQDPAGG
jgi:hypothetical protein